MEAKRRKLILKYRGEPLLPSPIAIPSSSRLAKSTHSASVVNARSLPETAPPISAKDWTFDNVLQQGERFKPVKRISALSPGLEIARAIEQHEASGEPLIIEGYQKAEKWSKDLFNVDWLIQNHGQKRCSVRNVTTCTDEDMTLEEYIGYTRTSHVEREQLLYYKDADCPSAWRTWVNEKEVIPPSLRPGGENDLMQHLTQQESVESLMCYLGVGDTFTPCHKDLCGSSGHNIMCYTENDGSSFWFLTASSDAPLVGVFFQEELHSELDWEQHAVTLEQFAKAPFTVYVAEQKLGDLVLIPPRSCHQVVNHGGLTIKTSWSRMTVRGLKMALQRELPIYRRVCRREQYRVKYIVYRSLLQYTKQLSDLVDDEVPLRAKGKQVQAEYTHPLLSIPGVEEMARTLETVLQLFDSIIYEEFARNHDALPTIPSDSRQVSEIFQRRSPSKRKPKPSFAAITVESTSSNFACDFCGSDIFQSFFECQSCAIPPDETVDRDHDEDEEPASTLTGDGLIICPSCYVEGRTCACGIMHAAQCRPFSLLINRRNDAAAVLRKLEGDFDKWADLPTTLTSSPYSNIFEAGCVLLNIRKSRLSRKTVRTETRCKQTHFANPDHCLNCSACHYARCYPHLLAIGIHSSEALFLHGNRNPAKWHSRHLGLKTKYERGTTGIRDAELVGDKEDVTTGLVHLALNYPSCRSLNPGYTMHGWYDTPVTPDSANGVKDVEHDLTDHNITELQTISLPTGGITGKRSSQSISTLSSLSAPTSQPPSHISSPQAGQSVPLKPSKASAIPTGEPYVLVESAAENRKRRRAFGTESSRRVKRSRNSAVLVVDGRSVGLDSDEEDRRVQEDYASSLAKALASVNAEEPQFTSSSSPGFRIASRLRSNGAATSLSSNAIASSSKHPLDRMSRSLVNPSPVVGRAPIPPSEENPDCIQQTNSVTRRPRSGLRNKKGRPPGLPANEGQAPRDIDPSAHGPAVSAMTESGTNVDQVPSTVDNDDTADQVALQHPPTPDVAGSEPRKQAQHNVPTSHPRADGSIEDLAASFHNAIRATQTLSVEFQAERKELRAMQSVLEKRLQAEIGQRSALELRVRAADQEILSLKVQHRQLEAQLRHEIERGSQAALGDGGQEVISQEMTAHMRSLAEEVVKAQIDQLQATHRSQPETPSSPSNLDNELVAIFRKSIPSMMENFFKSGLVPPEPTNDIPAIASYSYARPWASLHASAMSPSGQLEMLNARNQPFEWTHNALPFQPNDPASFPTLLRGGQPELPQPGPSTHSHIPFGNELTRAVTSGVVASQGASPFPSGHVFTPEIHITSRIDELGSQKSASPHVEPHRRNDRHNSRSHKEASHSPERDYERKRRSGYPSTPGHRSGTTRSKTSRHHSRSHRSHSTDRHSSHDQRRRPY